MLQSEVRQKKKNDIDIGIDFIYFDSVQANLRHKINQRLPWRP